jgi:hypothetical protein
VQSVNEETPDQDGDVILTTSNISEGTNLYYTNARFDTRYATKTHYHNRYSTEAESERSGATATLEVYYTARPDGDGYAESEVSDVGETDIINRTLYYSDKFEADPDTAGDWTQYTTQPADNATFATAKAALLAGLNDTDATAETRGTLPLSLKMVRTTTAPSSDLLLDTYTGASAAFSVRKLDKDYTGYCMKVREDSGDTEADIGFDGSGGVDQSAIATHCGSANGYVVTWYDQSGNAVNATQSTAGNQPQIYNGTAVITENGKPALNFDGGDVLPMGTFASGSLDAMSALSVCRLDTAATSPQRIAFAGRDGTSGARVYIPWITGGNFQIGWNAGNNAVFGSQDQDQHLWTAYGGTVNSYAYKDGTGGTMTNQTSSINGVGYSVGGVGAGLWLGPIQECIIWNSDQHSNRTGIETDVDTYFSIT